MPKFIWRWVNYKTGKWMTCVRKKMSLPRGACVSLWEMLWSRAASSPSCISESSGRPPSQSLMGGLFSLSLHNYSTSSHLSSSIITETWPQTNTKLIHFSSPQLFKSYHFYCCNVGRKNSLMEILISSSYRCGQKYCGSSLLTAFLSFTA